MIILHGNSVFGRTCKNCLCTHYNNFITYTVICREKTLSPKTGLNYPTRATEYIYIIRVMVNTQFSLKHGFDTVLRNVLLSIIKVICGMDINHHQLQKLVLYIPESEFRFGSQNEFFFLI